MSHPKRPVYRRAITIPAGPQHESKEGGSSGQSCLTKEQWLEFKQNSSQFFSECVLHHSTAGFSRWPGLYLSNILQYREASWERKSFYCQKSDPSKKSLANTKFVNLMDKTHITLQSKQISRPGPATLNSTTAWKFHIWFIHSIYFW